MRRLAWPLALLLLAAFAFFVWPTPFVYVGQNQTMRRSRVTGEMATYDADCGGWQRSGPGPVLTSAELPYAEQLRCLKPATWY